MVRINLDYYRILSVPIKASSPQVERAYGDRLKQQPRRDYSKSAIAMRKKLLTRAFKVLSDPGKKAEYDNKFLEPNITTQAISNQVIDNQTISDQVEETASVPLETKSPDSIDSTIGSSSVPAEPYLEIENHLVIGALIILHELAEYELVISIGNEYLRQENDSIPAATKRLNSNGSIPNITGTTDPISKSDKRTAFKKQDTKADTIFCIALSCLEIGREKWRRQEWEEAAAYGEEGLRILQQENQSFCPHLQTEIQSELNLLKPYRILYLLEHNTIGSKLRSRGLKLLQEVLVQREGIENTSIDPSGLKSDQFLYFIQQIRNYLTLAEQKELFLGESKRGSRPGSCIASYALIAEGFAKKKPSSIMQANDILVNLGQHQNTHWERAVCALLLGQAEESQEVIEQIRQDSTYALIKKRSHNSPDLLPGLCFYAEQWLNKEVLSQFQDLKSSKITLSEYFNDSNVQAYLNTVAPINYKRQTQDSSEVSNSNQSTAQEQPSLASGNKQQQKKSLQQKGIRSFLPWLETKAKSSKKVNRQTHQQASAYQNVGAQTPAVSQQYRKEATFAKQSNVHPDGQQNIPSQSATNFYKSAPASNGSYHNENLAHSQSGVYSGSTRESSVHQNGKSGGTAVKTRQTNSHGNGNGSNKHHPNKPKNLKRQGKSKSSFPNNFLKSLLLLLALVGGLGTLSFLFTRVQISNNSNKKIAEKSVKQTTVRSPEKPKLDLNQAKTVSPSVAKVPQTDKPKPTISQDPSKAAELAAKKLNQTTAKQVVQKWLDGKKAALGKNYDADQLGKILTAGMLTQWKERSSYYKQNKIHRQLSHTLDVSAVKLDPTKPNIATVEAEVTEVAQHYQGEKLNQSESYNDKLLVRYNLIKQGDSWLIKSSEVIKTL